MRWLPDKMIVSLDEVEIDMYTPIIEVSLFRNVLTLPYLKIPPEATESQLSIGI